MDVLGGEHEDLDGAEHFLCKLTQHSFHGLQKCFSATVGACSSIELCEMAAPIIEVQCRCDVWYVYVHICIIMCIIILMVTFWRLQCTGTVRLRARCIALDVVMNLGVGSWKVVLNAFG